MASLAVMKFRSYLEQSCLVRVTDGRWFEGHLMCTDRDSNIVLARTCEMRGDLTHPDTKRFVGLVMIPGRHIVEIFAKPLPGINTPASDLYT